jgi:hypothetical protein
VRKEKRGSKELLLSRFGEILGFSVFLFILLYCYKEHVLLL